MTETIIERDESLLTVTEVAGLLKVHVNTVARWCKIGVQVANGEFIRLDHVKVGRQYRTSKPAVNRFVNALAGFNLNKIA